MEQWHGLGEGDMMTPFQVPVDLDYIHRYRYDQWKAGVELFSIEIPSDYIARHFELMFALPSVKVVLDGLKLKGIELAQPSWEIDYGASFKYGYLLVSSLQLYKEEKIFPRFAKVFEQAYTRFLDLQKAEAQAREAQIEAALERVRSRSMAMHKSEELKEVIKVVLEQFVHLNINVGHSGFYIDYKAHDDMHIWLADPNIEPFYAVIPYFDTPTWNSFLEAKAKGTTLHTDLLDFKEKNKFYRSLFKLFEVPEEAKKFYLECKGLAVSTVLLDNVGLYIENFEGIPYSDEENAILMRFGKVFQQTYTRFLDLQKAEAQAREAQIEAALERIRGKVTSMQESSELLDIVVSMRHEFVSLGHEAGYFWYMRWLPEKYEKAMTSGDGTRIGMVMTLPRHIHGDIQLVAEWEKSDEPSLVFPMDVDTAVEYVDKMITLGDFQQVDPQAPTLDDIRHIGGLTFVMARTTHGEIGYSLAGAVPNPPAEDVNTLIRFAAVFDLAYKRFEDLKESEKRNRETQIELALERVRSRTMAMHKSDELLESGEILFSEMQKLGIESLTAGYVLMDKDEKNGLNYTPDPFTKKILPLPVIIPHDETDHMRQVVNHWKKGSDFYVIEMDEEETIRHQTFIAERSTNFTLNAEQLIAISPARLFLHNFYFKEGYILIVGGTKLSAEQTAIMLRFAKVFQQTYTRFLDLQKAEVQAREAQIEAALERVRARAMAMHSTTELKEVVHELRKQMGILGQKKLETCVIHLHDESEDFIQSWAAINPPDTQDEILETIVNVPKKGLLIIEEALSAYSANRQEYVIINEGEKQKQWFIFLEKESPDGFAKLSAAVQGNIEQLRAFWSFADFAGGSLLMVTLEVPDEPTRGLLRRFSNVFGLAYRRFADLKQAEAQAREAQIEAALERVRSRTLAMQKSDELAETAAVLFQQLIVLGIAPNRLFIIIIKEDTPDMEAWLTDEDGSKVSMGFTGNYLKNTSLLKMYEGWEAKRKTLVIDMQGEELQQYFHYLHDELNVPFKGGLEQKRRVQHLAYFSHGMIGMASPDPQPNETLELLERFAAVFNLTFTRFNDLQIAEAHARQAELDLIAIKEAKQKAEEALTELQATQKQLIQSEKMASLGELTAGIAHEIQNPLNFVNNFSEVSKELLDEMKEAIEKGDADEAKEIMNDVIQNLEKINHHGKRADGIVKGMLQHSRSGSNTKEPTDVNALCDEYLRLAYHGLRAKDKSFNAKFESHFDVTVGKIEVMPQDMGRVVLNLINNAFYAVSERKKAGEAGYEPTVVVSTKKENGNVIISVRDNGTGIPQKVLDKNFQPFFTTKPTGQGTGLGLSLSYDIIKAHGGELKVETEDGEGSTFIITLPA